MGWVWIDDKEGVPVDSPNVGRDGEVCSTRTAVRTRCNTEEVEPGKFIRKCHKTEEVLRECLGKPPEVLKSDSEYTEEDVTNMVTKGSFSHGKVTEDGPFSFPGLRSDIDDIERHVFGGLKSFIQAAEELRSDFFDIFDDLRNGPSSSSSSRRIPIDVTPKKEASTKGNDAKYSEFDLSRVAKDV